MPGLQTLPLVHFTTAGKDHFPRQAQAIVQSQSIGLQHPGAQAREFAFGGRLRTAGAVRRGGRCGGNGADALKVQPQFFAFLRLAFAAH